MSDFEHLDFYELLGVSRSSSLEEIKRAYRREISKYHPDRFVNGTPDECEYASRRSQYITEAYSVLSDFAARTAYNRGERSAGARTSPSRSSQPIPPTQPRDYQAELYQQAQEHLAAARIVQAIGVLRQLQQLNPFYRDSADLLAMAEEHIRANQAPHPRRPSRTLLIVGGFVGGFAALALVVASLGIFPASIGSAGATDMTSVPIANIATTQPSAPPAPTAQPIPPTAVPNAPTNVPTMPTAIPSPTEPSPTPPPRPTDIPPTDIPPSPIPTLRPSPVSAETGKILSSDAFATNGWADLGGSGWHVGYERSQYHITIDPGIGTIWSYRTGPEGAVSIGVDVQARSGAGGLLLWFVDENNYLSYSIDPAQTSYRLEQHSGGVVSVLANGRSKAIQAGAEAQNRIVARLHKDRIDILVNDQQLTQIDLPNAPQSSRYGLLAISGTHAADAYFDNLTIRSLR